MPSIMGDEPRINSKAIRDPFLVLWLCLCISRHAPMATHKPNPTRETLVAVSTHPLKRVATAAPAPQNNTAINSVETTWPVPACNAANAVFCVDHFLGSVSGHSSRQA